MSSFEPKIVGMVCRWCTYQAADSAGTGRMEYPANITLLRVQCSGRVDPTHVIRAFEQGADGVFIGGCHPGECHYEEGNYRAMGRISVLKRLLEQFGIEKERVRLEWASASEASKFVDSVREFTESLKEFGPLDWEGIEVRQRCPKKQR